MNENKLKHLELIQGVIGRMAGNSFALKGWSVVLVSAMFVLAARDANVAFVYLAYFPAATFWILDGYFLRQERLFRKLYDRVRQQQEAVIDFAMDTTPIQSQVADWFVVTLSRTLTIFHGTIIGTIVITMKICWAAK